MTECIGRRLRTLIDRYEEDTGQPGLSLRKLARQMRAAGSPVAHTTLSNVLNGNAVPDWTTRTTLAGFFGVSPYYFDSGAPQVAELYGRLANLSEEGQSAVRSLLDQLDELGPAAGRTLGSRRESPPAPDEE